MSDKTELVPFTALSPTGPIAAITGSGRFARQAVAAAFNIMGGVDAFAEWAKDNRSEFYTKLFTKTIGREVEVGPKEKLEDLLLILDGQSTDITDSFDSEVEEVDAPILPDTRSVRLARAAETFVRAEVLD